MGDMKNKLIILFSFLLMACGPTYYPRQQEAEDTIWSSYQEDHNKPIVTWIHELNCSDGNGWTIIDGHCVAGLFYDNPPQVLVAIPSKLIREDGVPIYSKTALAHEFLHDHLKNLYGDADGGHTREEWGTLLYTTNSYLEHLGL